MSKQLIQPRKALNKAFLKIKPNRTEIEVFKTNLIQVLDSCNDKESEEFHKNLVSDFLKKHLPLAYPFYQYQKQK
jgi:ADP-glucose pyrophosphorylase